MASYTANHKIWTKWAVTSALTIFILLVVEISADDGQHTDIDVLIRRRRDVSTETVEKQAGIPENIPNDVILYDLGQDYPNRTFIVTGNIAGQSGMFVVNNNGRLVLAPGLSATKRRMFDYDKYRIFDVYVNATNVFDNTDIIILTVRLTLQDVNDELPVFTNVPKPFQTTISTNTPPETVIYRLTVADPDTNANVVLRINQASQLASRFVVRAGGDTSGGKLFRIVTQGTELFTSNTLRIYAEDTNAVGQRTDAEIVMSTEPLQPQFYQQTYRGRIYETQNTLQWVMTEANTELEIQVKQFQQGAALDFQLLDASNALSQNFEIRADGSDRTKQKIRNIMAIDYEGNLPKPVNLIVRVVEASARTSSATVIVDILDDNDNSPIFAAPQYRNTVPENRGIGSVVLTVFASDLDSGVNGEIEFALSNNTYFAVRTAPANVGRGYQGEITVVRELDYEKNTQHTFNVIAKDKGPSPRSTSVQVNIYITNVNDNDPEFLTKNDEIPALIDTASPNAVVAIIQATDKDGDRIQYFFGGRTSNSDIFRIEASNGLIRLTQAVPDDRDSYNLTVLAVDDDSCCTVKTSPRTSTATFTVQIRDINVNKPNFVQCRTYDNTAVVKEKAVTGTEVIVVQATDRDRGENGRVLYRLESPNPNDPFAPLDIDETTGNITVKGEIVRGQTGFIQVTVVGRNPGDFPLMEGRCTFRLTIMDINDHAPSFSQDQYTVDVSISTKPPSVVRQMVATDADVGSNANLTYSFDLNGTDADARDTFSIHPLTGVVTLIKEMDAQKSDYTLIVIANDQGTDPSPKTGQTTLIVTVNLEQRSPPSWVNQPSSLDFEVKESDLRGYVVTTLTCQSNSADNPRVEYRVFDAKGSITSDSNKFIPVTFQSDGKTSMNLTLNERLDYETEKEHQLSIVCQTFGAVVLRSQLNAKIIVTDTNDNIPSFQGLDEKSGRYVGTVAEDANPGTSVLQVSASDADSSPLFRTVTFSLIGENKDLFRVINQGGNKADILTSTSLTLDREAVARYSLQIEAQDSAPADPPLANQNPSRPNTAQRIIDIVVNDVNDNPPSFSQTLYTFNVSETANVNDRVAEVKADDPDSLDQGRGLNYIFTSGNVDNAFSILAGTGKIRVARKLDYESAREPKIYDMTLMAVDLDQRFNATTRVRISVMDENDNRPEFSQNIYRVEGVVTEEDASITQTNPLFLVQVTATDKDVDRPQTQIRYSLVRDTYTTPGPNQRFRINATSGEVFLVGKLDREVNQNYVVTVAAEDELIQPNIEYADVVVSPMDINDNNPKFSADFLQGNVDEHAALQRAMTVLATDPDEGDNGTVQYRVAPNQGQPATYFTVRTNGDIFTIDNPAVLDREKIDKLEFVVQAYDLGSPSREDTATVTITLNDINDQAPYFPETLYNAPMSENLHEGGQVKIIEAIDKDSDPRNKDLRFEIRGDAEQIKHFAVMRSDQSAVITVVTPVDYETDPHRFSFELHVTDGEAGHENTTNVVVIVEDYNDNPPVFTEDIKRVIRREEESPGELLATFNATDDDEGINAEFEYSIVRSSDPRYEFYIHPSSGEVTTRKKLDREVEEIIEVTIMAKDKGEKPLNSTAKLIVTLIDINDNAPQFKENYRPKIMENENFNNLEVVELFAIDPDTPENGPPFGFKMSDPCPTQGCEKFSLTFNPDGDNRRGSARITTSGTFDREEQKEYHLPIVMWDQYGQSSSTSQTATNTLTVIIGDENDNDQKPGHQDMFVYNYEGQFENVEIGRVYVDDPDDWDLPDKTFTFLSPDNMKHYFSVASDTGMVSMKPGVPSSISDPYRFQVRVTDQKYKSTVTCTVSVTVQPLSDESVRKSAGVRLAGITAEEFVKPSGSGQAGAASMSKYDKFRQTVASMLGYPGPNNIDIVSLIDGPGYLDVRFSGHASPFVNPSQGESVIMLDPKQFESDTGVTVAQVPINLCMEEIYDDGCYNNLNVTGAPRLINSNGTSYVVMDTSLAAKSGCVDELFPDPVECRGDYCFNGGTCHKDDWGKLSCSCPAGFDGPRCQQRRHNFDGTSIAFYKGLSVCSSGRTSIEFITLEENGIIMFSGPINEDSQDQHDYLLLELIGGYPSLTLSLGTNKVTIDLDGKNQNSALQMNKLSDGQWHHVDIDRDNQKVTLTIDRCKDATATANGTVTDWSSCRKEGTVPGPDVLLNVQSLLQLGGRYQSSSSPPSSLTGLSTKGFSGCLRNLVHNSKLYDLHFKALPSWKSGNNGCPQEQTICGEGSSQPECGSRATCESRWQPQEVASCRCHPGWYGQKCDKEAPTKDLKQNSYFKWQLSPALIDETRRMGSLQMMFRTRQTSGTLMTLSTATSQQIKIQLNSGKLRVSYDMGTEEQHLILSNAPANTGQMHVLRMERYGSEFILSMDGGEGRKYGFEMMDPSSPVIFEALQYISAGAGISNVATVPSDIPEDLVSTCVRDIRYNDKWLPLTKDLNKDPDAGASLDQIQGVVDDCVRNDCEGITCPDRLKVCYPLWEAYECRCGEGHKPNAAGDCIPLCDDNPCFNDVECEVKNGQPVCTCPDGWRGPLCDTFVQEESDDAGLGAGAIVGIIIGILLLIILIVLLLCLLTRRNKEKEKILEVADPDDDFIRENVMFYDEEGAGEEDHDAYDITLLQRPDREAPLRPNFNNDREDEIKRANAPRLDRPDVGPQPDRPDVGSFIKDRIQDTENDDPFNDSTREFNFEGGNSDAGSLSSLNTTSSGGSQDYDYLSGWGPKFAKLADMYGAGQNLDD